MMELRSHAMGPPQLEVGPRSGPEQLWVHARRRRRRRPQPTGPPAITPRRATPFVTATIIHLLIVMNLLRAGWNGTEAVSVQKLSVPDLVVIDQLNQQQPPTRSPASPEQQRTQNVNTQSANSQPEAASLINGGGQQDLSLEQITFECLISFDKRRDKNLVVKWHHDDRVEPIYQWIPELNKRSIAPQYRAYIAPIVSAQPQLQQQRGAANLTTQWAAALNGTSVNAANAPPQNGSQIQLLEAGFRLVRPTKELGGKYTCSAISVLNDDSKWKKMIVYTAPRSFRFNASRTDIGALLASHRERLIQPSMIGTASGPLAAAPGNQLPLAYRMRGLDANQQQLLLGPTTISPQMYSTIDYVNVNQQRVRQSSSPWLIGQSAAQLKATEQARQLDAGANQQPQLRPASKLNGVKLVCDIDQVFPVPEVSIYKLAKPDGSHPDKLVKLDTRIERNPITGLYHVQVISILEDDELQMKYGLNEPVYFECLIALTNLELSKYSDNKRTITYRPGKPGALTSEDINSEQAGSSAGQHGPIPSYSLAFMSTLFGLYSWLLGSRWRQIV